MKVTILVFFTIILLMQVIQIDKTNPTSNSKLEIEAPAEIKTLLVNACYDCHSNQTVWPWYSSIAPVSWIIEGHVDDGRRSLNFEEWASYSEEEKKEHLREIYRTVYASMPPKDYIRFNKKAEMTKEQRELIREWTGVRR